MGRTVGYTNAALADLHAVTRWLTQPGSGRAAHRRLAGILSAIDRLREHPCRHPLTREPGVRSLQCRGGYYVTYQVNPDTSSNETAGDVLILRIFGPGQSRDRP